MQNPNRQRIAPHQGYDLHKVHAGTALQTDCGLTPGHWIACHINAQSYREFEFQAPTAEALRRVINANQRSIAV